MCSPAKKREFLNLEERPLDEQKLFHRVGNRRQVLCMDMSGLNTRGPTLPTLGFWSRKSASASRQPGNTITSGFTSAMYRPRAWRIATLLPLEKPKFSWLLISFTQGNLVSTISTESSLEALSTTSTSMQRRGGALARLSRQSSR